MEGAALEGVDRSPAAGSQPIASTSGRRLTIPRDQIPLGLLVSRHDPAKVPASVISTRADVKRANRDAAWANRREQLLALAAAGVHVLIFAYNLAFWGQEGMPPDRYWPANPRIRLQIKPPRYGNLEGTKRIWYDYLAKIEGA